MATAELVGCAGKRAPGARVPPAAGVRSRAGARRGGGWRGARGSVLSSHVASFFKQQVSQGLHYARPIPAQ